MSGHITFCNTTVTTTTSTLSGKTCPGSVREQEQKEEAVRARLMDQVHILLDKKSGHERYSREIAASCTEALINGVAVLIVETAEVLNQPVERVFAVLATVLFAPSAAEQAEE